MSCSIVITGTPSRRPSSIRPGRRIIDPSSATISAIAPTGSSPASRMSSTAASVCPPRSRTPPSTARSGRMCPGRITLDGVDAGFASTLRVCARSAALMPVVMPSAASTLTVYAVPRASWLVSTIGGRSRASARSAGIGAQMKPLDHRTVHAIHSGVASCADRMTSPSFSRFSSSATMTGRPARRASRASEMGERLIGSLLPDLRRRSARRRGVAARGARGCRSRGSRGHRPRARRGWWP